MGERLLRLDVPGLTAHLTEALEQLRVNPVGKRQRRDGLIQPVR